MGYLWGGMASVSVCNGRVVGKVQFSSVQFRATPNS